MVRVIANGYIGLTATDLDEWRTFATEVLGMAISSSSTDDELRLRIDERDWRVSIEKGEGGHAYSGWEVANKDDFAAMAAKLEEFGVEYVDDKELADRRGVRGLLRCQDPGGTQVEIFYGAFSPRDPFVSPTGAKFVTSDKSPGDLGYGHHGILFPDYDAADRFYLDILGLRISDTVAVRGGKGDTFVRANGRHHSFAYGLSHNEGHTTWFDHFMVQVETLEMVGLALDRVKERGIEIVTDLGKHINDHVTSFYIVNPSGTAMEYGALGRLVDEDNWIVGHYDWPDIWGHQIVGNYYG
ncbi:VOC family protein [Microbacterium atlanticum]|uniref:VOC family protein n=1 Tax=Microbacterium atlanticum TaxID=2782168 RepID=UPI001887E28F|nr:VOC family protein [Microbacterium atlanticum]